MRELRELKLPRLVEARNRRSTSSDFDLDMDSGHPLHMSQSSVSSDYSPITPTFSIPMQGHSRFPSSSSSLAGSPTMRSSMDGYAAAKRPLTEVREEPHERENGFEMIDAPLREGEELEHAPTATTIPHATRLNIIVPEAEPQADYDWEDAPYSEAYEFESSVIKRRCGDACPTLGDSASGRFPAIRSLSRKFKGRKDKRFSSLPDSFHESMGTRSRAGSLRSPSVAENRPSFDLPDSRLTPALSPSDSFTNDSLVTDAPRSSTISHDEKEMLDEEASKASRTPLLPPVMATLKRDMEPVQSPLQSPKIASSPSIAQKDPFDSPTAWSGLPSPPLSTKPSISSFHHRNVVPPSDIPPMTLADPDDKWARDLGHANFTIYPEPYTSDAPATAAFCRQLRGDWDMARRNFAKHLARIREHHGTTSKTHQLTQEKWAEIDASWKRNYEETVTAAMHRGHGEAAAVQRHSLLPDPEPVIRLPSICGPQTDGKFPRVGDVGIVGPMEVVRPLQQRPVRKRNLWTFLQGMLPTTRVLGRSTST